MSCSELNFQVRICKSCYNSYDENVITYLDQPSTLTAEFNPDENNQAFDIVIQNYNNDPWGDDNDTDEYFIDNN